MIGKILDSKMGQIIISIILGLGLATVFRKVCKDNCVIVKGPSFDEINKYYYKIDDDCFKYTPQVTHCNSKPTQQEKPPTA
jgi:hypothetical protein